MCAALQDAASRGVFLEIDRLIAGAFAFSLLGAPRRYWTVRCCLFMPVHVEQARNTLVIAGPVKELGTSIDDSDDMKRTPLMMAAASNSADVIDRLVDAGGHVNAQSVRATFPQS